MLECMHRIEVDKGDVILIDAGTPHAMGSGCLFLEIHEPCDYTIRTEKMYLGKEIPDADLHYGMGFDAMFTCSITILIQRARSGARYCCPGSSLPRNEDGTLSEIISCEAAEWFSANALTLHGAYDIPDFDGHYIMITTAGETTFQYPDGSIRVPQGRGVFVPGRAKGIRAVGDGEIVIAYPYPI